MTQPPLQGVIFDMDGVLCDSEPFICKAACRMFQETYRAVVKPEDFIPFVGTGEDRYLGGPAAKYRIKLDLPRDKARTYAIYLEIIKDRLHPLPGAVEFIQSCRKRGLKLAIATSADRVKLVGNLCEIQIPEELFDAVVTGCDVQRKKPDPQIFLLAAQLLVVPAQNCLVVEDAPNGVQAAKSAGAACLGLTSSFDEKTLRAAGADWVAKDLAHVPATVFPES